MPDYNQDGQSDDCSLVESSGYSPIEVLFSLWILEWYQKSSSQRFIYDQVQVGILSTSSRAGSFTMDDVTL